MKLLEELNIDTLPPIYDAELKQQDLAGVTYYYCNVNEVIDGHKYFLHTLISFTKEDRSKVLNSYGIIETISDRSFNNFKEWYNRVSNKGLTNSESIKIQSKFKF